MHLRLPALLFGFATLIALLALPSTLAGLCMMLLLTGSLITPQWTATSVALDIAAPEGTVTEAFGWLVTATTLGAALGESISGQLIDLHGPALSFLTASAVGVVLAAVLVQRRHTLDPTPSPRRDHRGDMSP